MLEGWNCIVITCPSVSSVIATEKEIKYLKKKRIIPDDLCVLTIEDPAKNIGSGAATLNALLVATEHLSVKQNFMVVTSDVLNEARILILHNGRNYIFSCTEKAFIPLPLEYCKKNFNSEIFASGIVNNLESALQLVHEMSKNCPYGIWVCSTDMMILKDKQNIVIDWQNIADVVMFCVPSDLKYATGHGVVAIDEQGYICDICYCGTEDQIKGLVQDDGKVPLVSGIVFLSVNLAESLLSLHVQAPLDSCTYLGLDSGAEPIQVSLFFDILIAMSSKISKESFIAGKCGKTYNIKVGIGQNCTKESILARSLVWNELSKYRMSPKILRGCQHLYWSANDCAKYHMDNLNYIAQAKIVHSLFTTGNSSISSQSLFVNSLFKISGSCEIASSSIIYDSIFDIKSLSIGENSFISGASIKTAETDLSIPSNIVVINAFTKNPVSKFVLVFGTKENLMSIVDIGTDTFCNQSWKQHFKALNITEDELWPADLDIQQRSLMNAKLFIPDQSLEDTLQQFQCYNRNIASGSVYDRFKITKRYSISDVMNEIDYTKVSDSRRKLYAKISTQIIRKVLIENEDLPLLPYFNASCAEDWHFDVMNVIDQILLCDVNTVIKTRALSNMADLLGAMAGLRGGLRTGPGSNPAWNSGFTLLLEGRITEGLQILKNERSNWLDRPDHIIRAARHYERAAQILIQRSVKTVIQSLKVNPVSLPEFDTWITAKCPVRIDLQGGWSDTPPICYELGGSVVNIAVLVDGARPIGAKACRIKEPSIFLKLGILEMCQEIKLTQMKDILNYDQPNAQGALLKAALICANIIDVHSTESLAEQLLSKFGGGFVIQSWSLLPQGCGMGSSSILAGAVVSVIWSVSGKAFDKLSVVHAVLYVEQLLTTGGGWQDQVSGILGGINRGYSEPHLPLKVKSETVVLPSEIIEKLNSHFLLIYTGKVRLAKNLLQNVIRNWYAREESVVKCFKNLIKHSHQMKEALEKGDLAQVGSLMDKYWEQKKILAPGCEPIIVKNMMELLKHVCYGQLLVGAGGGGFMCILTKEANAKNSVKGILSNVMGHQKMSFHTVTVDSCGLEITVS